MECVVGGVGEGEKKEWLGLRGVEVAVGSV